MTTIHGSYETVSATRYGFDIAWILGGIAQRPPQLIHGGMEPVLKIDECPFLPDPLTKFLVRNYITGMGQQYQQDLKRLAGGAGFECRS